VRQHREFRSCRKLLVASTRSEIIQGTGWAPPQPNILKIYQILSRLTIEAAFLRAKLLPRSLLRLNYP
jgi:hypothetical protein